MKVRSYGLPRNAGSAENDKAGRAGGEGIDDHIEHELIQLDFDIIYCIDALCKEDNHSVQSI